MSIGTEHIIVNDSYIQFKEDTHVHSLYLRRPTTLTQDVYIDLPTDGGALAPSRIVKSADESRTSDDVLSADDHLTFAVVAGKVYEVTGTLFLHWQSPNISAAWDVPGDPTGLWTWTHTSNASTTTAEQTASNLTAQTILIRGVLQCDASGTATLTWAQSSSNATPSRVLAGSYLIVRQLN